MGTAASWGGVSLAMASLLDHRQIPAPPAPPAMAHPHRALGSATLTAGSPRNTAHTAESLEKEAEAIGGVAQGQSAGLVWV